MRNAIDRIKHAGYYAEWPQWAKDLLDTAPSDIPFKKWPIWAIAIKQFAKPQDKGVGDIVARMIGDENSAAFKAWFLATFKHPCGCTGRQARWNIQYPLNQNEQSPRIQVDPKR